MQSLRKKKKDLFCKNIIVRGPILNLQKWLSALLGCSTHWFLSDFAHNTLSFSPMATGNIVQLEGNSPSWSKTVEDIVKLERKIFPKHESLARSFVEELRKKNSGLLYMEVDGQLAGYVMYSWPSSLYASITKLAGFESIFLLYTFYI